MDKPSRNTHVLKSIIDWYVETAVPVSSRVIARRFGLSSATIRNVMADLEEQGLISRPHRSAGGVPTDKGYRLYVDSLMELADVSSQYKDSLGSFCDRAGETVDEIVEESSKILSLATHYTSIMLLPKLAEGRFKCIKLIALSNKKIVVVLITMSGRIKNFLLKFEGEPDEGGLEKVANFLNDILYDIELAAAQNKILNCSIPPTDLAKSASWIMDTILQADTNIQDKLYLEGANYILEQPEFCDSAKRIKILRMLERKEELREVMNKGLSCERPQVRIGKEIEREDLSDCSLVMSSFKITDNSRGSLGILGPTRMAYAKAISLANVVSSELEDVMEKLNE